ncbi:hypothetical protein JOF56_006952 [Kibdelosporangium banguiense]|uniref:DUF1023 domain-containing protein n=1 Tax=Kibdelosporangium banguiense TaxID=1365924 RepID=A0ABS4TQ86_9PSEU|nr:alpha/beta hydrolase [Kibdelosporangium banguiense]MBP2326567.1 hypothetical protein [Kibdelosporangium banguiense]
MSQETVPGHDDLTYNLLNFDEQGRERGSGSREVLARAEAEQPTDLFVFSHGWNGDVPAARSQYGRWIATMAACAADRERAHDSPGGFRSLLVGLHWPSKAWGDEEIGTDPVVERFGGSPEARAAIGTIVDHAMTDIEPEVLPPEVVSAYEKLDGLDDDKSTEGDRVPFDAEQLYQGCRLEDDPVSFGSFGFGGILAPLRVLSFWKMKKRARTFGETGAAALVGQLQQAASDARIHLVGHSFGCIVTSAAAMGAARPVASLSLIQGAMSLWSFCSAVPARPAMAGHFRPLVANRMIRGPVVVTRSVFDRAVGTFYPLGAWSGQQLAFEADEWPRYGGIGVHGLHGPDVDVVEHQDVRALGELTPGKVHNVDARTVIATTDGIAGAHNDICHPELGHLVWQAVAASR